MKTGQIDLRLEIKRLINNRFRCEAFLGEDIPELQDKARRERRGLDIELDAARKADSILIILGSPGTISEVTAFGLDTEIKSKIRVFNDLKYKNIDTFVNLAISNLLEENQIQYVDGLTEGKCLTTDFVQSVDAMLSRQAYHKLGKEGRIQPKLSFEEFILLASVCATQPATYQDIHQLVLFSETQLRQTFSSLFSKKLIQKSGDQKYTPTSKAWANLSKSTIFDIAAARSAWLFKKAKNQSRV